MKSLAYVIMAAGLLAACSNSDSDHATLGSNSGGAESTNTSSTISSQANSGAPVAQQQPIGTASQQSVAMAGDDVRNAQAKLQAQGYYHGRIDGIYGPRTRRALIAYQRHNALQQTAILDTNTMASLNGGYGASR